MSDSDGIGHLFKVIGYGILYFGVPFLPMIAIVVAVWAMLTQGLQSALGAIMGFFTGILSLRGIPEFENRMKRHWSLYTNTDRSKDNKQ